MSDAMKSQVSDILTDWMAGRSITWIAKKYGVSPTNVGSIIQQYKNRNRAHS